MPIYEYKCENGHVFDIMQKMSENRLETCIECEAPVKKLMHPVNISFKGSGFYSTDYKGSKKTETTDSSKSGSTETSSGSEKSGGSESKPESNGSKSSESSSTEKKAAKKD